MERGTKRFKAWESVVKPDKLRRLTEMDADQTNSNWYCVLVDSSLRSKFNYILQTGSKTFNQGSYKNCTEVGYEGYEIVVFSGTIHKVSMDKNMNQELYIILLTHEKKTPRMIAQLRTQFAIGKGTKIINYSMIFQ